MIHILNERLKQAAIKSYRKVHDSGYRTLCGWTAPESEGDAGLGDSWTLYSPIAFIDFGANPPLGGIVGVTSAFNHDNPEIGSFGDVSSPCNIEHHISPFKCL